MAAERSRPRSRAATLAALAGFAAFVALALGSGLDRLSAGRPALVGLVPTDLQSASLRSEAAAALQRGEARAALTLAERAVYDAPLDPHSTALLAAARRALGDNPGANRAARFAAGLGWRVPYSQTYALGMALSAGDYRMAALRLDALLRQDPRLIGNQKLFDPFEQSALGRVVLAERLASGAPWARRYAMALDGLAPAIIAQRSAVLFAMGPQRASLGCVPIGPMTARLVTLNQVPDARALLRQHCAEAARDGIVDKEFARAVLTQTDSEFSWVFPGQAAVTAGIEPASSSTGKSVIADSDAPRPVIFARQRTVLEPGSYILSWSASGSAGALIMLGCQSDPQDFTEPGFDSRSQRWSARLDLEHDCAPWIGFAAQPGARGLRVEDLRLAAA